MNCEKVEDLPLNTSKDKGVLQRYQYLILKRSRYDLRLEIVYLSNMHIIVFHINFLYTCQVLRIFILILL
jgi:hypothetical protein